MVTPDAEALARRRQPVRGLVDVAGEVGGGEPAAVQLAVQGRLNGAHFLRRHGAALQPASGQERRHAVGPLEVGLCLVEIEDAPLLAVELDAGLLGHPQQMPARLDRQHSVSAISSDVAGRRWDGSAMC